MATKSLDNTNDRSVVCVPMQILDEPQPIRHHEADEDIKAGRVKRFSSAESMIQSLRKSAKK